MKTWKTWITTYILICYIACVWTILAYAPENTPTAAIIGVSLLYTMLIYLGLRPDIKVAEE